MFTGARFLNSTGLGGGGAWIGFSVVCFRRDGGDEENEAIVDRVNKSGEAFLSHTRLNGRYVIRLAIGSERTTEHDVRRTWDALRGAAAD